ncbi:hypothetical protein [Planctomicrobium piriforme]|uniref:Uncharacterized protein n=1 Tax=Planctomicrobium piriforme TaxID=1576369 RepID=A0A1I3ECP2_9PLAN|nr:hypothetical protein [Planctomicrobium piriforme]SFH96726.1 hypothetical protein SAMN05421753_104166 [Planctomicrobium piriforme]
MAGTYSITILSTISHGNLNDRWDQNRKEIVQNAIGLHEPMQSIGTSEEVIGFGDLGTVGRCEIINLDGTNYVDIGPESGGAMVPMVRLKPGECHAFRLKPGITLRGQANTAACKVQFRFYED